MNIMHERQKKNASKCILENEWGYMHAWAVPNEMAIKILVDHSPIVEIGAGTGYWAMIIANHGGKIDAYDSCPPLKCDNVFHGKIQYYPVKKGSYDVLARPRYENWTLFLCWPPPGKEMAINSLLNFQGQHIIYAGEWESDCNATKEFFDVLQNDYHLMKQIKISQHTKKHSANDVFVVFERD